MFSPFFSSEIYFLPLLQNLFMKSSVSTPDDYVNQLDDQRKIVVNKLREVIKKNLPKGFIETISYGTIGYVVPHSLYPKGYHCDPKQPLPFIAIASQKNYISLHHMGIYADKALLQWFENEYKKNTTAKLDMGKGCIRFKKLDQIPFDIIGKLASKMTAEEWVTKYESVFTRKK